MTRTPYDKVELVIFPSSFAPGQINVNSYCRKGYLRCLEDMKPLVAAARSVVPQEGEGISFGDLLVRIDKMRAALAQFDKDQERKA